MNVKLLTIGKTDSKALSELIDIYIKRLGFYLPFQCENLPDIKNNKFLSVLEQKEKEGISLLKKIEPSHFVVLLDERGKQFTSEGFSKYLQQKMNTGHKQLTFIIGGPYGFSQAVYQRANEKISLSQMTFSHQMIRLFFTEQLYRACTILRGEAYHHP